MPNRGGGGAEGSKRPFCFWFGGSAEAKVPSLKVIAYFPIIYVIQRRSNELYLSAKDNYLIAPDAPTEMLWEPFVSRLDLFTYGTRCPFAPFCPLPLAPLSFWRSCIKLNGFTMLHTTSSVIELWESYSYPKKFLLLPSHFVGAEQD